MRALGCWLVIPISVASMHGAGTVVDSKVNHGILNGESKPFALIFEIS